MPMTVTLTPEQYRIIREQCGYSNYAWRRIIGVSLRQAQRYENGDCRIPETVARLMWCLAAHGVPPDWR